MSKYIPLYPILTEELINKAGYFKSELTVAFGNNSDSRICFELDRISTQEKSKSYLLKDNTGSWSPEKHYIYFNSKIFLRQPKFLFSSKGIAPKCSEIGIGIVWTCRKARQRGATSIKTFSFNDEVVEAEINFFLPPGQTKGELTLETILFLASEGHADNDELHLINRSGCVLGELERSIFIIDGNGSIFPIVERSSPNSPLWEIESNWEDIRYDSFFDNIQIIINPSHPEYSLLEQTDQNKWPALLKEIISSALTILIYKAMLDINWPDVKNNYNLTPGSVGHIINYFITTFGWQVSDQEKLSSLIRKDLDNKLR